MTTLEKVILLYSTLQFIHTKDLKLYFPCYIIFDAE